MSKERLEEIKNNYEFAVFPQDVEWLIKQAERVPELESHLPKNGNKYRNQNKRLRKELKIMTRKKDEYQEKARLRQMRISSEDRKKVIRDITLEGYKNLRNKQRERIEELEGRHYHQELIDEHVERLEKENNRYREAVKKAIGGCRYTNTEVAYILTEALEANK